ncbi:MAG: DUF6438 domain-containing protein [Limnohabitans sp.]|nr:DUF6438 domain-containing protein [Limnohabitans sp.]
MKKLFILSFFTIISCKEEINYHYQDKIIGNWTEIEKEEFGPIKITSNNKKEDFSESSLELKPKPPRHKYDFSFHTKSEIINREGFFKNVGGKDFDDRRFLFLGTKTKYIIDSDSLKILDKVSNQYDKYRILSLDKYKLCLIKDRNDTLYFKKRSYNIKCKDTFDKIFIQSSGCYGICPISSTLIDKNGQVIFEGIEFNTRKGLYTSKFNPTEFQEIITSFQKANWVHLENSYKANHTDDELLIIIFIRNNKIIKTVTDYGRQSPEEFVWAYQPLRFFYQKLKLTHLCLTRDNLDENTKLFLKLKQKNF